MQLKTLLNRIEKHKSFVYGDPRWNEGLNRIEVPIEPRANGVTTCSACKRRAPLYDRQREREFDYVPIWGIAVVFLYTMRRVKCEQCGVRVEDVPWSVGKSSATRSFTIFLAQWARLLSWTEVAERFGASWHRVYSAVRYVVEFGLKHRDLSNVTAIGVDEVQFGRGHSYLTLVYQINEGMRRLLFVGKARTVDSLARFFRERGKTWCRALEFVCSDMWKPYLQVIAGMAPNALNVLDRYHVVARLSKAIDDVRAAEAKEMKREGYEELLKHTRYCFLKNPENLTDNEKLKLKDVLKYDLKSVRAYLLKEAFRAFWNYTHAAWARWFLRRWCARAMRSKLEPIKKFVGTLRRHEELLMNYFRARKEYSCGAVEGLNRKVNLITRKSYGFRSLEVLKTALYHAMGQLPEPETTHSF